MMNAKDEAQAVKRRQFLKGVAGLTAVGAAWATWHGLRDEEAVALPATPRPPQHTQVSVYRETAHIRRYYETARL